MLIEISQPVTSSLHFKGKKLKLHIFHDVAEFDDYTFVD